MSARAIGRRHSGVRAVALYVAVMVPLLLLALIEDLLHHSWGVAAALIVPPVAAWLLGRWQGARSGQVMPRRDRTRAELAQLRAQVARFEDAAGRSLDAATAGHEHIPSRMYGGRQ